MRTLKNISIIGSGTALAQGITAIAMPALTRLYAPEAFTDWAIFVSIAAIFSGVATMRFELAMVLPKDRKTAAAIGLGSIGIALVASAFAGFILWIFGPWILEGNAEGSFGLLSLLLSLGILSGAIFTPEAIFCPAPTRIRGAAMKITLSFRHYQKSSKL